MCFSQLKALSIRLLATVNKAYQTDASVCEGFCKVQKYRK